MPVDEAVVMTPEGKRALEEQLEYLQTVKRPEIAEKIGRAASDGDLSENGAYHQAKEDQGWLEGKIAQLEKVLRHAQVAEQAGETVGIGTVVTVKDEAGDEEMTFRIVSSHEVNSQLGRISDRSPVGSALVGAKEGDVVEAHTPGRSRRLRVLRLD